MTIATYTVGSYVKPFVKHDSGFLDQFPKRAPTVADHIQYQWWVGKLSAAEAAQNVPFMPHNDISDALAAYRHFLNGTGNNRIFSYERYVANDPSGKLTLSNAIADAMQGAWEIYQARFSSTSSKGQVDFEINSTVFSAGAGSSNFPYPATENWQKAIGAHNFWLHAYVKARPDPVATQFEMDLTFYAEDMYNFNPGAADIATGIPDAANGIFEVTGLAKQYLNVAQLARHIEWRGKPGGAVSITPSNPRRERQPSDNRRVRTTL